MLIKYLEFNNIRSYVHEIINFPKGSILLSGDIGSGKTSILSALEFALFGLTKEFSGNALLRKGTSNGFVKLKFSLGKKEYIIKRTLKKAKSSVVQDTGYLEDDKGRESLTPVELKSRIYELLGYPKLMVTKSKNLIYRFTVYTPQEAMKQILFEHSEERLETIRKLFNIDKYKIVRENASELIRKFKQERKILEAKISDINSKKELLDHKQKSKVFLEKKLNELLLPLTDFKKNILETEASLKSLESELNEFNKLRELKIRLVEEVNSNKEILQKEQYELKLLEKKFNLLEKDTLTIRFKQEDYSKIQESINKIKSFLTKISAKKQFFNEKVKDITENKKKIQSVEDCPFCKQKITDEHKLKIQDETRSLNKKYKHNIDLLIDREKQALKKLNLLKPKKDRLEKERAESELQKLKQKQLQELTKEKQKRLKKVQTLNENLQINMSKLKSLPKIKNLETKEKHSSLFKELELFKSKKQKLDIEQASLTKEVEGVKEIISIISTELKEKEIASERINNLSKIQNWIEKYLIKISTVIEKKVLSRVHTEFNELFQSWFRSLIEDDILTVRLNDEFAPVVIQNGFETSLDSLSGGEKTAISFSYRLSMNKVVNDSLTGIKSRNLLILDEPTDGFSTEQLDKLRDVLDQTQSKQLILVSHEHKLESFVDTVMQVTKTNHISKISLN